MPYDILFDLDGTLIDSSPGILASFERVLAAHGMRAAVPLEASLIGPPLAVTLRQVSGIEDEAGLPLGIASTRDLVEPLTGQLG